MTRPRPTNVGERPVPEQRRPRLPRSGEFRQRDRGRSLRPTPPHPTDSRIEVARRPTAGGMSHSGRVAGAGAESSASERADAPEPARWNDSRSGAAGSGASGRSSLDAPKACEPEHHKVQAKDGDDESQDENCISALSSGESPSLFISSPCGGGTIDFLSKLLTLSPSCERHVAFFFPHAAARREIRVRNLLHAPVDAPIVCKDADSVVSAGLNYLEGIADQRAVDNRVSPELDLRDFLRHVLRNANLLICRTGVVELTSCRRGLVSQIALQVPFKLTKN